MTRFFAAGSLALALLAALPAHADVSVSAGTRGAVIANTGPIGESFVADNTALKSFGFQFGVGSLAAGGQAVTFQLLSGAGLGGTVLATRNATLSFATARTPTWYDFDLTGTSLTLGQSYTALVSSSSAQLSLYFGPALSTSGVPASGDAYGAGKLVSTNYVDASGANGYCATSGSCDANFRFTTLTGATAAVPEAATWATMMAGLGMVGGAMRRRRTVSARVRFA